MDNIDNEENLDIAFNYYQEVIKDSEVKPKGLMDFIREDPELSRKITFEEAVLRDPSLLAYVENGEEYYEQAKRNHPEYQEREIDDGLEEAYNAYVETAKRLGLRQ